MSSLVIEVLKVDEIVPHPDPETIRLEIAKFKGWQCVVPKGQIKLDKYYVYFPIDSILPKKLSDSIGITKYLSNGRVKIAKLRGIPSFGILWSVNEAKHYLECEGYKWQHVLEDNKLAEYLGVKKWEPPPNLNVQDAIKPNPLFTKYTDIENLRHYVDIFNANEEVIFTEKLHGGNHRFGYIDGEYVAGSHNIQFKENKENKYWYVVSDKMRKLVKNVSEQNENAPVIMYGEIIGVQDLKYGLQNGHVDYRCFDIKINEKYLDFDDFMDMCDKYDIPTVPILYQGPYTINAVLKHAYSKTYIKNADNIMEGIVIKPVKERFNTQIGRTILKYVFDQYLGRNGGTEYK